MPRKAPPFDERYIPEPMSGCFLWLDGVSRRGYGQLKYHGRDYGAHRFSWMLHRGDIPAGMCVLHKCDTPSCVNPDHLFLGTNADNSRDMSRKKRGRTSCKSGEKNNVAKLTEAQVLAIRADPREQRQIAQDYGIRQEQVSRIRTRQRWAHI